MNYSIYPFAKDQLVRIWLYTDEKWGTRQADKYLKGIEHTLKESCQSRRLWRKVPHKSFPGIFFIPYERHFIFFRQLSDQHIGVISILHERQDIPEQLKQAARISP